MIIAVEERERTVEHLEGAGGDGGEGGKTRAPRTQAELPLFAAAEHPVAEALRALEVEALTPLEALNRLAEWKKRWG